MKGKHYHYYVVFSKDSKIDSIFIMNIELEYTQKSINELCQAIREAMLYPANSNICILNTTPLKCDCEGSKD
jgi:hypothetical protein